MIAVIDYGVGNIHSLVSALDHLGAKSKLTNCIDDLKNCDRIILPGVGAFKPAMEKLNATGLVPTIIEEVAKGKSLFGICLGMQLLYTHGLEYGEHKGLAFIPGDITSLKDDTTPETKIPHMGWNKLNFHTNSPLFKYIKNGDHVYFVHSYYAKSSEYTIASSVHGGVTITAITQNKNVYGTQFHPEKSGDVGINLLKAFIEI